MWDSKMQWPFSVEVKLKQNKTTLHRRSVVDKRGGCCGSPLV